MPCWSSSRCHVNPLSVVINNRPSRSTTAQRALSVMPSSAVLRMSRTSCPIPRSARTVIHGQVFVHEELHAVLANASVGVTCSSASDAAQSMQVRISSRSSEGYSVRSSSIVPPLASMYDLMDRDAGSFDARLPMTNIWID